TYRVSAVFTGRIDSVFREVHAAHAKRTSRDQVDGKGFGHMGMLTLNWSCNRSKRLWRWTRRRTNTRAKTPETRGQTGRLPISDSSSKYCGERPVSPHVLSHI